jgi:predicted permease
MIRSLVAQVRTTAGVDTSRLVAARLEGAAAGYDTALERQALYRQIDERMESIRGVRASFANAVPLGGFVDSGWKVVTDGAPGATVDRAPDVGWIAIGSRYFETLGAPPVRGREFDSRAIDREDLAIVNERFADVHFGGQDPIGRRIRLVKPASGMSSDDAPWRTIVGVAPNVRQSSREGGAFEPLVYVPLGADPINATPFLLVRSDLATGAVATMLRGEIGTIDRDLALIDIQTVDDLLALERWEQRFAGTIFTVFAGVAVLLAAVGLYGVTTHSAAQRTREIGIRIALGAQARHVWSLVTRRAGVQLAIGLALGIAGGLAVAQILPSRLAGTSPLDPVTFLIVAVMLIAVGFVASFVPARRAMRVEPVAALRAE